MKRVTTELIRRQLELPEKKLKISLNSPEKFQKLQSGFKHNYTFTRNKTSHIEHTLIKQTKLEGAVGRCEGRQWTGTN